MKVTEALQNSLKAFFIQDFKITRIEQKLNDKEILVVLKFLGLKSEVYVVTNLDFKIQYIL